MIVLGVQSPLCVEVEETCLRARIEVVAAIQFGSVSRWLERSQVVLADEFDFSSARSGSLPCAFAPQRRRALAKEGENRGLSLAPALVDPTAILAHSARLSPGVFVNAGAIIGAASMVRTGAFVNRASSIGHHCVVGSYASIGPGVTLASNVVLEDDVIVGAGAVVLPDVRVGAGAIIGAGATVMRDIPGDALVLGPKPQVIPGGAADTRLAQGSDE